MIDRTKRLAVGTLSGSVDGAASANAIRTVYEDVEWQPGFDTFWDCTGITELLLGPKDLASCVALHRAFGAHAGNGLEIILVSRPLDHAMATIYGVLMRNEARRVRVCRSAGEAADCLDQRA
jgi:hypothetical protein